MAKTRIPKNLTVAELNKLKPGQGTTAQKSRVARLLANPGTRHLLADRFLSPEQQQTRKTNVTLAQPVVPGSTVTNRELRSQRSAASSLKYGGAETQAGRDIASRQAAVGVTGGYFDNYLAELRAHEANQAQINAQSQAAVQGLAGSVQGLAQNDAGVVSQGNQSLQAATGASPASVTQDASNASMLRQALTASFGAMLAGQGANASRYADTLAHVVGPGQKLQGLTRAQGDVTKAQQARSDLAKEKGAFEQQFENEFRQNESKNVLAGQIAGVKSDQAQQQIDIQRGNQRIAARALDVNAKDKKARVQETAKARRSRERIAADRNRLSDSQFKTKYGLSKEQQREKERHDRAMEANAAKRAEDKAKAGKGPDWQTNAQQGQGASDAANLKDLANKAKQGTKFNPGPRDRPGTGVKLNRHQAAQKIFQSAKVRDPALLSAALDAAYDGHLSPVTVRKLIAAGYKPSKIAQALGVPTAGDPAYQRRQLANAAQRPGVQPLSPNPPRA